jgi:glutathione S-transferase
MSITFYYGSGSPYAWRVWLALEHKQLPYKIELLSFAAGDLRKPEFLALNPRHKTPVIVDDGFALYESAAIVEYLEDAYPTAGQPLFPKSVRERAVARRLIREADQYVADALDRMVGEVLFKKPEQWNQDVIEAGRNKFSKELSRFENYLPREGFFMGSVGAVDFTLYPQIALALRMELRKPDLKIASSFGPKLTAWKARVETLPYFVKTIPPHWKEL